MKFTIIQNIKFCNDFSREKHSKIHVELQYLWDPYGAHGCHGDKLVLWGPGGCS